MLRKKSVITLGLLMLMVFGALQGRSSAGESSFGGGTKVRVAVARFGATDRFAQVYGGWDIGGGLSAQLVTELIHSGKVIVVERAILSQILREQELTDSKLVTKETAAQVGQLLGVDYLIVGEVTEFEQKAIGGGGRVGWLRWIFPKGSAEFSAAHVGIDLRVIDTTTGEILHSHRSEGRAWEKAVAIDLNLPVLTFGGDAFHKTPLGKATRQTIHDALSFILGAVQERVRNYDWIGKIIHQEDQLFYLNAGNGANVHVGDRLSVFSIKKVLTDPETNQTVGMIENPVGEMAVTFVSQRFSKARLLNREPGEPPKKGDVVRFKEKNPRMGLNREGLQPDQDPNGLVLAKAGYPILD
ncbi:MAG: CsgG/HfaB family protein [Candidatus Manganitrophaceae bacterium]